MTRLEILVRSKLRDLGVTRYAGVRYAMLARWRRRQYRRNLPRSIQVGSGARLATMLVNGEAEFVTLTCKRQDHRLVNELAKYLSPGGVFWDVGANIGFYSILAARIIGPSGRVVAFEPEPRARRRIEENAQANAGRIAVVSVLPIALGDEHATMGMRVEDNHAAGGNQLVANDDHAGQEASISVAVAPGDAVRTEHRLPMPQVIKIDVEGFELEVLQGLRETISQPTCRALLCEVHFGLLEKRGMRDAPLKIENMLRHAGFLHISWPDRSHLVAAKI